ncbi:hypothetical protein [Enterococcus sp. LJL128]
MSKRPIYLPIELADLFELIEDGTLENVYFQSHSNLYPLLNCPLNLSKLKTMSFYIKTEYTPKSEQGGAS